MTDAALQYLSLEQQEIMAKSLWSSVQIIAEGREWQPIETAPKDGTRILLAWWRPDPDNWGALLGPDIVIGAWDNCWGPGSEEWLGINVREMDGRSTVASLTNKIAPNVGPTLWMPLPTPPPPQ